MNKLHYFMVGMPSAGKTSFVVRLCSQLLMNEGTLMYRLSDGELPEGYEYIKGQLDTMQGMQNIMRTFESTYYDMVLPLTNEQGEKISLEMPDLSFIVTHKELSSTTPHPRIHPKNISIHRRYRKIICDGCHRSRCVISDTRKFF